jgi:hypothetical protein
MGTKISFELENLYQNLLSWEYNPSVFVPTTMKNHKMLAIFWFRYYSPEYPAHFRVSMATDVIFIKDKIMYHIWSINLDTGQMKKIEIWT